MKKFIVDQMMIRLGRWLRLAGYDVSNPGDSDDPELLRLALKDGRTLVTRDRGLSEACARAGASCILIRSDDLGDQLKEISSAGIELQMNPRLCTICNGPLSEVDEFHVPGHIEDGAAWRCLRCGRIYWNGSHWKRIQERFEELRGQDKG